MTTIYSLWTDEDQKTLEELCRKRGFADVALGLRNVAYGRQKRLGKSQPISGFSKKPIDYGRVINLLTGIYDHIKEGRELP